MRSPVLGINALAFGSFFVLMACRRVSTQAQSLDPRDGAVEAVWLCREQLSLRNRGTSDAEVSVSSGSEAALRVVASGRDTTSSLAFVATIVVLRANTASVDVTVRGQSTKRLDRPSTPCVRDLPETASVAVTIDYTHASSNAKNGPPRAPWIAGVIVMRFNPSAKREHVNALIRAHDLTLIGGSPGLTTDSGVWTFWIEDAPTNERTRALVATLQRSPLVAFALVWAEP